MFGRKFSSNIRRKKRMITSAIILLVVFLGLGYAAFTTDLSIGGALNVSKYDHTLYGVLEKAVSKGYAREYTGEHQDSMAGVGTKKIYHWYAEDDTAGDALANEILDKNNVIFAGHCWQMIRTTDTGGVKMLYNGEVENNQCLNTRGNHVGYAIETTQSMSTNYYYGTSYTYNKSNNTFSLSGTVTTGTIKTGQYTCLQTTNTGTCATLYLVDKISSGTTYNVIPLNSNSKYSQFGVLQYNKDYDFANIGYMYNVNYPYFSYKGDSFNIQYYVTTLTIANYYYSDTIDYGNLNANKYTLINPQPASDLSDYSTLIGKYLTDSSQGYSDRLIYIVAVRGSSSSGVSVYYTNLRDGDTKISMVFSDSYIDNGNGTYTLTNPIIKTYANYYNQSDKSEYIGDYVCDGSSAICNSLHRIVSTGYGAYWYYDYNKNYKYSESVSYSNGTYTLTGDIKEIWDFYPSANRELLKTHHYTCFTTGTTCNEIIYINNASSTEVAGRKFNNAPNMISAIENMLSANDVNQTNSTIKTGIDAWYKRYLSDYTFDLEDIIHCNDRSVAEYVSYDPSNETLGNYLYFRTYFTNTDSSKLLKCVNETDKFSLSNNKAKLTYPISLIQYYDLHILKNSNLKTPGKVFWTGTPYWSLSGTPYIYLNSGAGYVYSGYGVRPAISLKPGTEYVSGTGSMDDPYIVGLL